MIDYDALRIAATRADMSPNKSPEEWAEAEGFDLEGLTNFSREEMLDILAAVTKIYDGDLEKVDVRVPTMMGVMAGLRYANLVQYPEDH